MRSSGYWLRKLNETKIKLRETMVPPSKWHSHPMNKYRITTQLQRDYANYLFIDSRKSFEIRNGRCTSGRTSVWGHVASCVDLRDPQGHLSLPAREWGTKAYLKQRGWRNINDARKGYWRHRVVPLDLINLLLEKHNTRVNIDATCHRWNIEVERRSDVVAILLDYSYLQIMHVHAW